MINTILIDHETTFIHELKDQLGQHCPQLKITGIASSLEKAHQLIKDIMPELVFLEVDMIDQLSSFFRKPTAETFETILISTTPELPDPLVPNYHNGCITKPLQKEELIIAVNAAQHWIQLRHDQLVNHQLLEQVLRQQTPNQIIAIPTMEGMEFVRAQEIIRCEGLQRFTRIITTAKENIISSYNIGAFRNRLEPFGFFQPHKSHLINLNYLRRFLNEGTIVMQDGSFVPVSRRKRSVFLERVREL